MLEERITRCVGKRRETEGLKGKCRQDVCGGCGACGLKVVQCEEKVTRRGDNHKMCIGKRRETEGLKGECGLDVCGGCGA